MNVFDEAIKTELQGKACYDNLAGSTQVPGLHTVFTGLAADEQKHCDVLRALKAGTPSPMADSDMLDRAKRVVLELMGNKEKYSRLREDLDGYRFALKLEAESVRLYEDMAKKEQNAEIAQLLLQVANEEKKHYNIMENVCDFVMQPRNYLEWRKSGNLPS